MKNLKITTRIAISTVFLLGAILFLVHAFFCAKQVEELRLQHELDGVAFLTQVTKASEALSHYRMTLFRIKAGEPYSEEKAALQRQKVEDELQTLRQFYNHYGQTLKLTRDHLKTRRRENVALEEIERLWKSVAHADYANIPLENYNQLFKRMMLLSEYVTETSELIADIDLASHSLTTAITLHVTEVIMRTLGTESDGYESVVNETGANRNDQLNSWDYGVFVKRDNLRLVQQGIENSDYYEIDRTPQLKALDQQLWEAAARYQHYGEKYADLRVAMGEGHIIDHAHYTTNSLGFMQAMFDLWYIGAKKLSYMLEVRKEKASSAAYQALVVTLTAITLAFGFFMYVTRGIVTSLKDIEISMDRVANGELNLDIPHLNNRDEIGSMARTLERFRRSYWWLKD